MFLRLLGWLWKLPAAIDHDRTLKGSVRRVPGQELFQAYMENAVAADREYLNQVVETGGQVHTLRPELDSLALYVDVGLGLIRCEFSKRNRDSLAGLKPRQTVTVRGVVRGLHVGNIVLGGCRLPGGRHDAL